jgi:Ca2+-binding RTX toxin-like protein
LTGNSADNFLFGTRGNDTLEGGDGVDTAAYQGNIDEYDIYYNEINDKYTISDKFANRDGVDTLFSVETVSFAFSEPISIQSLLQGNAPAITSNGGRATAQASLPENGTAVTTVTATDVDAGTTLAYSISGGADAALFSINAATGALRFKKAPDFEAPTDAGSNNVYDVIIQVSDGSLTDTQALAVTVQDVVNELLMGTSGADTLTGAGGNDTLKGGAGNDRLVGKSGADRMFGGAGNDTYYVENAGDRVYETASEASTDTTDLGGKEKVVSSISFTLSKFVEDLTLTGTGNSNGTGNDLANTILGNSGANTLKGLAGNDILKSGSGNDKLFGGAGKDALTGGKGADIFVFDAAPASRDTITDFSRADGDKIHLSKAVFKGFAYTGTLLAEDFYAAAGATTARDATDRVIYNTTTGILYYDADGAGGAAAAQVALLGASTHPALLFSDLQIIA